MVGSRAKKQVKAMLHDTIMTLCRNVLSFNDDVSVEGLLGITIDKRDIFLVNINETISVTSYRDQSPQKSDVSKKHYMTSDEENENFANNDYVPFSFQPTDGTTSKGRKIKRKRWFDEEPGDIYVASQRTIGDITVKEELDETDARPVMFAGGDGKPIVTYNDMTELALKNYGLGEVSVSLKRLDDNLVSDYSSGASPRRLPKEIFANNDQSESGSRDQSSKKKNSKTSSTVANIQFLKGSKELPYACTTCKKEFRYVTHLRNHMSAHTDERPFKCDVCRKSFKQKVHLTIHRRVHDTERPFKCEACPKRFSRLSHMRHHLSAKHTKVKVVASKRSHAGQGNETKKDSNGARNASSGKESSSMLKARKNKTVMSYSERKHVCQICEMRFRSAYHLRRHYNSSIHKNDPKPKMIHTSKEGTRKVFPKGINVDKCAERQQSKEEGEESVRKNDKKEASEKTVWWRSGKLFYEEEKESKRKENSLIVKKPVEGQSESCIMQDSERESMDVELQVNGAGGEASKGEELAHPAQHPIGMPPATADILEIAGKEIIDTAEGCEGVANVEAGDVANVEAGHVANVEAGHVANVEAGHVANVEAGHVANVEAGHVANVEAGHVANVEAGHVANVEAGHVANVEAGHVANVEAGDVANVEAGDVANVEAGDMTPGGDFMSDHDYTMVNPVLKVNNADNTEGERLVHIVNETENTQTLQASDGQDGEVQIIIKRADTIRTEEISEESNTQIISEESNIQILQELSQGITSEGGEVETEVNLQGATEGQSVEPSSAQTGTQLIQITKTGPDGTEEISYVIVNFDEESGPSEAQM